MPVAPDELRTTDPRRGAPARRAWSAGRTADVTGIVLALVAAGWALVAAQGREGARPVPVVALLVAMAAAAAIGRAVTDRWPMVVPTGMAICVAGLIALDWPGPTDSGGPPLGYRNANATLTALGVLAALYVVTLDRSRIGRAGWCGLAVALAAATVAIDSTAGLLCLLAGLALLGLAAVTRRAGSAVLGGAAVVVVVLATTLSIARGADPAGLGEQSGLRGELWAVAADLVVEEPVRGVGPGRFEVLNPVSDDADLRWAHHGYLQVAAEGGAVGLALLVALIGWAYVRVWLVARSRPAAAAIGAAAVTVVCLHATVEYVLHLAAIPLALALLIGALTVTRAPGAAERSDPGSPG